MRFIGVGTENSWCTGGAAGACMGSVSSWSSVGRTGACPLWQSGMDRVNGKEQHGRCRPVPCLWSKNHHELPVREYVWYYWFIGSLVQRKSSIELKTKYTGAIPLTLRTSYFVPFGLSANQSLVSRGHFFVSRTKQSLKTVKKRYLDL